MNIIRNCFYKWGLAKEVFEEETYSEKVNFMMGDNKYTFLDEFTIEIQDNLFLLRDSEKHQTIYATMMFELLAKFEVYFSTHHEFLSLVHDIDEKGRHPEPFFYSKCSQFENFLIEFFPMWQDAIYVIIENCEKFNVEYMNNYIDQNFLYAEIIYNREENYTYSKGKSNIGKPIQWFGDLKEFADLIVCLEEKKWIEISPGNLSPVVRALCTSFDFSATKKTNTSNTQKSLLQYLKPSEREHKVYTKRYKSKFDSILLNNAEK